MWSPTTHPGSFRCSLHKGLHLHPHHQNHAAFSPSHWLNTRRSAMTNSLVWIGTVEGEWVKRVLTALIHPSSHQQRRQAAFQPRPSHLSVMSKADDLLEKKRTGGEIGKEEEGSKVRKVVFGKSEMGRVLGKGTFTKVYHCRNLHSGDSMDIKVISKDQVQREAGMMDQIQREISVMRMVHHPNMVELKEKFGD